MPDNPTELKIVDEIRRVAVPCDICTRPMIPGLPCPFCAKDIKKITRHLHPMEGDPPCPECEAGTCKLAVKK